MPRTVCDIQVALGNVTANYYKVILNDYFNPMKHFYPDGQGIFLDDFALSTGHIGYK